MALRTGRTGSPYLPMAIDCCLRPNLGASRYMSSIYVLIGGGTPRLPLLTVKLMTESVMRTFCVFAFDFICTATIDLIVRFRELVHLHNCSSYIGKGTLRYAKTLLSPPRRNLVKVLEESSFGVGVEENNLTKQGRSGI